MLPQGTLADRISDADRTAVPIRLQPPNYVVVNESKSSSSIISASFAVVARERAHLINFNPCPEV